MPDGRVNLQAKRGGMNAGDEEQAMEAKLIAMLEPLAGAGNVRATVSVSYEQGSVEKTDEVYDPSQAAALSTSEERADERQRRDACAGCAGDGE